MKNKILIFISIPGMLFTSYLTYSKFVSSAICNINNLFSCNIVNTSQYSEIFHIPLAILGFLYFVIILILALKEKFDWIFYLTIPVLAYSLYLTYIEFFVIKTICLVCELTKVLMLIILGISYKS